MRGKVARGHILHQNGKICLLAVERYCVPVLDEKNVFSYVTAIHVQSARLFISCDVFACVELA
jgi:hypothetical protein